MKRLFCLLSALALLLQPVHAAQPPQRYLALTFDDGPSGELTEQLLEGLAARQVRVTFFVCGYRVEEFPDTLRHIAAGGHEIGLHSSRHDYMQKMDYAAALQDLTSCMQTVEAVSYTHLSAKSARPPRSVREGRAWLSGDDPAGLLIALLLGKDAAAVFLHVEAELPRALLAVAEHGAEVLIVELDAVFLRRAIADVAHQLMLLIGADEQRGGCLLYTSVPRSVICVSGRFMLSSEEI